MITGEEERKREREVERGVLRREWEREVSRARVCVCERVPVRMCLCVHTLNLKT